MLGFPFNLLFTVATLGLAGVVTASPDDREADRAAIRAHIDSVFEAYRRKDRATVRATHALDWRGFLRGSRSVIRGIDAYMLEADRLLGSPATFEDYRMAELDVVFHGDLALVSYVATLEWRIEGRRVPDTLRVLDVYAKRNGEWTQVASHVAAHPDALEAAAQRPRPLTGEERRELLAAREAVWRAFFAGDQPALEAVIPEETVAINAGEEPWQTRAAVLAGARELARSGARLLSLEYPRTEIQAYGDVAILYTTYRLVTEAGGQRQTQSGRGTEIFVRRAGRWVNSGWHLDSGR